MNKDIIFRYGSYGYNESNIGQVNFEFRKDGEFGMDAVTKDVDGIYTKEEQLKDWRWFLLQSIKNEHNLTKKHVTDEHIKTNEHMTQEHINTNQNIDEEHVQTREFVKEQTDEVKTKVSDVQLTVNRIETNTRTLLNSIATILGWSSQIEKIK